MDAMPTSTTEQTLAAAPMVIGAGRRPPMDNVDAPARPTLSMVRLEALETVTLVKSTPGFDRGTVEAIAKVLQLAETPGGFKFLVIDFAHREVGADAPNEAIQSLVMDVANLILKSSVVTVAVARGPLGGADLELALACNMLVAEDGATFTFDADPLVSVRTYALLAQKIGFVRAERLMENGQTLGAQEMRDLLLVKEVMARGEADSLDRFLMRALRRHNASSAIYRAQRIAAPIPFEDLRPAGEA